MAASMARRSISWCLRHRDEADAGFDQADVVSAWAWRRAHGGNLRAAAEGEAKERRPPGGQYLMAAVICWKP